MPRYFTFELATRMLPRVEAALREAIDLRRDFQNAEQEIHAAQQRITMLGGSLAGSRELIETRARREASLSLLKQVLEKLKEMGCLIKDLDTGLVDFPTLYRGEEVYLCWKLGEREIAWWHGVEEGFRGRKRIDAGFLAELSDE
jgi:hypothetical protein